MTIEEYAAFHETLCNEARELSMRKNNDYAAPSERPNDPFAVFANFRMCEHQNICSTEDGFLVRLSDKFSRIANLLRDGHQQTVDDESVFDTIRDILNYTILLAAYIRTKQCETLKKSPSLASAVEGQEAFVKVAEAVEKEWDEAGNSSKETNPVSVGDLAALGPDLRALIKSPRERAIIANEAERERAKRALDAGLDECVEEPCAS